MVEATAATWRERSALTRRQRSGDKVLRAARELFNEVGYDATSVEQIALEAGVGTATVYNRFGSKAGVVCAIIAQEAASLDDAASGDLAKGLPAPDLVRRHLLREATVLAKHRTITHALLYALADETRLSSVNDAREVVNLTPSLQEPLARLIRAGQQRGELASVVKPSEAAMMAHNLLILRLISVPIQTPQRIVQGILGLLMQGLLPREP
jgi:AcrR family transcriptional regulator